MRWDDDWARMKSISSLMSLEMHTAAGVFKEDNPINRAEMDDDELDLMCKDLTEAYQKLRLSTEMVECWQCYCRVPRPTTESERRR